MLRRLAILILLVSAPAHAQLCDGRPVTIEADGRALGHLPYGSLPDRDLAEATPGSAIGECRLRREVTADLDRLLAAAAGDPAVQGRLYALSCYRSIARQTNTFCRERKTATGEDRAISVAPPGHSEHATGYALDFTVRPADGCPDAEACMAAKPAFRWLRENAPRYGFELSFPPGNIQKVKWEPWHWRWVGLTARTPGASRARFQFARARRDFPADPMIVVPPRVVPTIAPPPPPPAPPEGKRRKKRKR